MQSRYVFTQREKVRLLARWRSDPVRAGPGEQSRPTVCFGQQKKREERADLLRFRVELKADLQPMMQPIVRSESPSGTVQRGVNEPSRERPFCVYPTPTEGCAFAGSAYSSRRHGERRAR